MKQLINNVLKSIKSVKGNSLAEFATTTALMATLAATAAPKLSEMSEGAKGEKSRNEIDKIVKQAGQFYQDTADLEGRGRFPNQSKFNVAIGGPAGDINYSNGGDNTGAQYNLPKDTLDSYNHTIAILDDLRPDATTQVDRSLGWDRFDEQHQNEWQMVFGTTPDNVHGVMDATNYKDASAENEWNNLFGDEILESKFQDGAYVYTVVAGGGTGNDVYPPTIYVADIESAVDFHNLMMP
jgi:hypothetical protein